MSRSIAALSKPLTVITRKPVGLVIALLVLLTQTGGQALTTDPLSYGGGTLITGNYVAAGIDFTEALNPPDVNGLSTGTIHVSGVPVDAEIVGAYLFFETITFTANPSQASLNFRGHDVNLDDGVAVKKSHEDLLGNVATCWSSGQPVTMWRFRVDVLRYLPLRLDKDNKPTVKHLVNDADLTANGQPLHTVTLPTRTGNQLPESAGASLVILYRDPAEPLRKIVFYDGIHIQDSLTDTMTQTLRGFYKSSATKSAKVTFLMGSGQPNNNERFFFNDGTETQVSPVNPVMGGTSSERAWSTLTYDVSNAMSPGNNAGGGFGETAIAKVDHSGGGGNDCLTWEGAVFSTAVADTDPNQDGGALGDGIPDGLEDATAGLLNPDGHPLPNLNAMGASSTHRDLFIEVNAMQAAPGTSWGSAAAPYDATHTSVTDAAGHSHMPTPEVLKLIGDAYGAHGITAHFDVGPHEVGDANGYHGLGVISHSDWVDDYTSLAAESYLVPSNLSRGGEIIKERGCDPEGATCRFPDYPGTVGWKFGLQVYRDAPVRDNGQEAFGPELTDPSAPNYFDWNAGSHRLRFDLDRQGLFHYVLFAHTRAKPKSPLPCLVNGQPGPYDAGSGTACMTNNPDFLTPSSASGIADVPGYNALVTLGRWDEFVGKPFTRASTAFHEIGHNLNLFHGGAPPVWGNKALNTATIIQPNCKTNYLSSMSYAFQVHGLFDDTDEIHLDYSNATENSIGETAPQGDAPLGPTTPMYRPIWYAPASSSLAVSLGASAATRYCSGAKFDPTVPAPSVARVFRDFAADSIDWNGDLSTNAANAQQDVNNDGALSGTLSGFNDWANLRLDQMSGGGTLHAFTTGSGIDVEIALGSGVDVALGDGVEFSLGDGVDVALGDGSILVLGGGQEFDLGSGFEFSLGEAQEFYLGEGLEIVLGSGVEAALGEGVEAALGEGGQIELDYDAARGAGRANPYAFTACRIGVDAGCGTAPPGDPQYHARQLRWKAPAFGHTFQYEISRKRGNAASSSPFVFPVPTSTTFTLGFVDVEQLPNTVQFTYRTRAEFDDTTPHQFSGYSKLATITAVNAAPVAVADPGYTTSKNKNLNVPQSAGVLVNDTDVDTPSTFFRAVLVSGPANGTLVLNANGSFSYNPKNGFSGVDTFTYKANDGFWSADPTVPLSPDSNTTTVTITVTSK